MEDYMEVKKIAYYQNKAIPLKIRMEAFARERLLLDIFKGFRYANKWAKVNCPR